MEIHAKEMREKDRLIQEKSGDNTDKRKRQPKKSSRINLTEPERRAILKRQDYKCNNPDGVCTLPGDIDGYDIDHIIPKWKGGSDHPDNLQALCPCCHRHKTDHERIEREAWESLCTRLEALPEVW